MREAQVILDEVAQRSQFRTRYDGPVYVQDKEADAYFRRLDATLSALLEVSMDIRNLLIEMKAINK